MAEFPIFEGQGQGGEATVRTSRIGPEPPRPEGLEQGAAALRGVAGIFDQMHKNQNDLLLQHGHEGAAATMAAWQEKNEMSGYNKEWQADFTKTLNDAITTNSKYMSEHGADATTIDKFATAFRSSQIAKLPSYNLQQLRLYNDEQKAGLDTLGKTTIARSLVSDPKELPGIVADYNNTIDRMEKNHVLKAQEADHLRVGFATQMAAEHSLHDAETVPDHWLLRTDKDLAADPVYKWLTPEQKLAADRAANAKLKNDPVKQAYEQDFMKAEQTFVNSPNMSFSEATAMYHQYPGLEKLIEQRYGKKPPNPNGDPASAMLVTASILGAKNIDQVKQFIEVARGNPDLTHNMPQIMSAASLQTERIKTGQATALASINDVVNSGQFMYNTSHKLVGEDAMSDDKGAARTAGSQMALRYHEWLKSFGPNVPSQEEAEKWTQMQLAPNGPYERDLVRLGVDPSVIREGDAKAAKPAAGASTTPGAAAPAATPPPNKADFKKALPPRLDMGTLLKWGNLF